MTRNNRVVEWTVKNKKHLVNSLWEYTTYYAVAEVYYYEDTKIPHSWSTKWNPTFENEEDCIKHYVRIIDDLKKHKWNVFTVNNKKWTIE